MPVVVEVVVVVVTVVAFGSNVVVPGVHTQLWTDDDKAVPALHKRNVPIALQAWL